jgi:hypothetical protein
MNQARALFDNGNWFQLGGSRSILSGMPDGGLPGCVARNITYTGRTAVEEAITNLRKKCATPFDESSRAYSLTANISA